MAAADTAMEAGMRASYTAFDATMDDWVAKVALALRPVGGRAAAAGVAAGLALPRFEFFMGRVAFDQFDGAVRQLNAVPSRFKLPPE